MSAPEGAASGRAPAIAAPAWYAHGLHTATSLRLILGIIPRVPRPLVPPLGVATTALCLLLLRRERRAVARNQAVLLDGARGWRLGRAVWRQFYSFSRYMVSHCDLSDPAAAGLDDRLTARPEDETRLRSALEGGRGVVVLTAHLGNWEAGAHFLSRFGAPVTLVMQTDRMSAAERWLMRRRRRRDVRVVRSGGGPTTLLDLRAALGRNEIVAAQGDRATGARSLEVRLCGRRFRVPAGPFLLAYLCEAPLVPAFVVHRGWWRFEARVEEPIPFTRSGDRDRDLAEAAARYAAVLERAVRAHPDQWFNFYDLWEPAAEDA